MPVVIIISAITLTYFLGVDVVVKNKIDKIYHIMGGYIISFSIAGILWHYVRYKMIATLDTNIFQTLVFGIVCFAVIS